MDIAELKHLDREIWIWGAKNSGRDMARLLERNAIPCAGFIDNGDIVPQALSFASFSRQKKPSEVFIIIASRQYFQEMAAQCRAFGLQEGEGYSSCFPFLGPSYEIDLHSVCNLRCPSCPQGNYPVRLPAARMSLDWFRKAVSKIEQDTPNVSHIALFCWSEPFLRHDLVDFITILREKKNIDSVVYKFESYSKSRKSALRSSRLP